MRSIRLVGLAVLALLALAPAAAAHVTVTAKAPDGPLPVGMATEIPVTISANCAVVLAEYEASGKRELELAIVSEAPSWLASQGEKVPFRVDMCRTSDATVQSTGKLRVTPDLLAPGLQPVTIAVGAKGEAGQAELPIAVAYRAAVELVPENEMPILADGVGVARFVLNASINADSMAMLEVTVPPEFGTLEALPSSLDVASPLADNKTSRELSVEFRYVATPGANVSMDMVGIRVFLHALDDGSLMSEPQEIMFHFMAPDHGAHGNGTDHDHDAHGHGFIPAPTLGLVVASVGLAAFGRRRRRA